MIMFIIKWTLIVLVVLVVGLIGAGRLGLLQGTPPQDLGVKDGRMKPPATNPNSVSSQASLYPEHPRRSEADIAPLPLAGDGPATMARLKTIIQGMPGAQVIKSDPDYLYVQFTTGLMRFVDDTEFWFDPAKGVVQVRSASRVGRKDFNVNRQRIEAVRAKLAGQ